ncbi:MAG: M20/M25/M40 family metallo-hydrolase, partial [Oceanococcus sp.]
ANADELRADMALVCDTNMYDAETPAIDTMLRGMVYEEVIVTAASRDLHSGLYGGAAQNPIRVLSRILADLHDDDGRITLPNFYDGVSELAPDIAESWEALNFDADAFLGAVGLSKPAGETAYSALQQLWSRPTCDVNGIMGGYTGAGAKTVIASKASAKVSFRLVGEQDPKAIQAAFRAYVQENLPEDCTVEFIGYGNDRAFSLPLDMPEIVKAQQALTDEWQKQAVLMGMGGSIPIVGEFQRVLGMDTLLIGFGLDDDSIHSPNEKYNLTSFHKGIRSWARVMEALAK